MKRLAKSALNIKITVAVLLLWVAATCYADNLIFQNEQGLKKHIKENSKRLPDLANLYKHPSLLSIKEIGKLYDSKNVYRVLVASSRGHKILQVIVTEEKTIVNYCTFKKLTQLKNTEDVDIFNEFESITLVYTKGDNYSFLSKNIYEPQKWINLPKSKSGGFAVDGSSFIFESFEGGKYNAVSLDAITQLSVGVRPDDLRAIQVFTKITNLVRNVKRAGIHE